MEENGARLNRLSELVTQLHRRDAKKATPHAKPRSGDVKAAVVQTLELSAEPMSLRDVHMACEKQLGRQVPYNTVKDCVHKHSRGKTPTFTRVSWGRYMARTNPTEEIPDGIIIRRRRHLGLGGS